MLPYKIIPMFNIGPFMINMYGIMFATGFFLASVLAIQIAKKRNIDTDVVQSLILVIFFGSIVGARLFYVLFYWPKGMPFKLIDILKIWEGGLAFYGGFLGATLAGYWFTKRKKLDFWQLADVFTLPLLLGHVSGRLGDYFTGGHPGKETDLPWAIYLQGAARHPVVLYEILGLILIGITMLIVRKKSPFNGFVFAMYIQLYAIQRMILDFFRIESTDPRYLGLTPSQILVVFLFIFATIFVITRYQKRRNVVAAARG